MADIIREWETINKIELLEQRIFEKSGIKPNNISHWNSSSDFQNSLASIYTNASIEIEKVFNYNFSYDIPNLHKKRIIKQLGLDTKTTKGLIVPTGTLSIHCALSWIKEKCKIRNIAILCPAYFAAFHICNIMNINYLEVFMKRTSENRFSIPKDYLNSLIENDGIKAIYVTNPVYCTSSYLSSEDIEYLRNLAEQGIKIVWDGCLSIKQDFYVTALCSHKNVVSFFEPHKPLAINGSKFSIVCFENSELDFFESRADIIYGGLSTGNLMAINHYLSNNYEKCLNFFLKATKENYNNLSNLVSKYSNIEIDKYDRSLYITCYFLEVSSIYSNKNKFLRKIIKESQCSFIPGVRNHFDPNISFCFRINLTRCDAEALKMLEKIFILLNDGSNI